jgi:hypothetical protein
VLRNTADQSIGGELKGVHVRAVESSTSSGVQREGPFVREVTGADGDASKDALRRRVEQLRADTEKLKQEINLLRVDIDRFNRELAALDQSATPRK